MVRDVFRLAKENASAIIFIDEIDAIATAQFDAQTGALIRRCNVYWWSFWTRYPHLHSHCTCLCTDQVGKMPNTPHWVEEHLKLHVLFAEHWKPCCMVSCRTLQGEKGVQEDNQNMCWTELNRGYLASCIKLFVSSLVGGFEVHNFLSSDFLDLNESKVWSQGFWQGTVMT